MRILAIAALILVILVASLADLERVPPLWWDEGWTLNVARNWVELGHYGQLLNGQPAPPGLSAAFPTVASVALSFKLLGVGIWQGRLPGVLYTIATLMLLYFLARGLYGSRVAISTLVMLLLIARDSFLHPIFVGRQVLAEMPMLFYLLAGYASFLLALRRSVGFVVLAIAVWGVALITKVQVVPFWTASLCMASLGALFSRQWKLAGLWGVGLAGSYMASQVWQRSQQLILNGGTVAQTPLEGLFDITALVFIPSVRLKVLALTAQVALPTILGLGYVVWKRFRRFKPVSPDFELDVMRLALLSLVGSWCVWYVLLSAGATRYLFPAAVIGSMFVAVMLHDLTDQFNFRSTVARLSARLKQRRFDGWSVGTFLVVSLLVAMFILNLRWVAEQIVSVDTQGTAVTEIAGFLNTRTAPGALIETYDSEILPFLNRSYRYPPDQLHVELIRRLQATYDLGIDASRFYIDELPINYDPLAADPDYLVVGPLNELWRRPYDAVLSTKAFRLLYANSRYQVYERAR